MFVIGLIGGIVWLLFQQTVRSRLRDTVQAKFNEQTAGSLVAGNFGSAEFMEGRGLRLNDLTLTIASEADSGTDSANAPMSQIEIYEAFVHLPISLPQLVAGQAQPTAIEIRRAKLQLTQNESGDWNIPALLRQIEFLKTPGAAPIPIALTDCTVELKTLDEHNNTLQLTDVNLEVLPIVHDGRPLLQVSGQFNGREVLGTNFTAYIDSNQRNWKADLEIPQFRLSPNVMALLPAGIRNDLSKLPQIAGVISGAGSAAGSFDLNVLPQFQFAGRLREFQCDDVQLPLPVRQMRLDFQINNEALTINQASGKLGAGRFQFDYSQTGLPQPSSWTAQGSLTDFNFDHHPKLAPWMPEFCQKLLNEYSPGGTANVQFELAHDGNKLTRNVTAQLTDMSFSYDRFPYAATQCTGQVELDNQRCEFTVLSPNGPHTMELSGIVKNPGPAATYQINIGVPGEIAIDDKLLDALNAQPKLAKIVADFSPVGRVSGAGRIEKAVPFGAVNKSFDVQLHHCIVRHASFDYPIHNVSGLVQARNDEYSFVNLQGNNSSALIDCNGSWNPTNGLDLQFNCKSVPLDNQLRFALKPELREIWAGFRPRGTLDLIKVYLTLPLNQTECNVVVDATMSKPIEGVEPNLVSINPTWFPYEIKRLAGNVKVGDGKIILTDMSGKHGRSWLVGQGDGTYTDDAWSVSLKNLLVGSLKVDDDLLAAVPKSLAGPIRQLNFDGLLNVQGEVILAGQSRSPVAANTDNELSAAQNSMAWNLRVDMNQASMLVGLPIKNVFGSVDLNGQYDGQRVACVGQLALDSLTVYDAQLTKISGPIWLDNARTAAGIYASQFINAANGAADGDFSPVATTNPAESQQVIPITASLHGGVVKFDAQMSTDPTGEFYLQTTLADGDLQHFCREFAPDYSEITGRSFAALRLAGDYLGTHSYRGDGVVQLRQAKIYELPAMLSLLKLLRVGESDRAAFDSSNVDFTIDGDDISLNRIEMIGEPISLLGNGAINLDREIDLNFYSVMGRNRVNIPVLSDMYRASSQQVLWINIDGTLDKPEMHRHVLPQINDSLKQLFQPPEQHRMARNWE